MLSVIQTSIYILFLVLDIFVVFELDCDGYRPIDGLIIVFNLFSELIEFFLCISFSFCRENYIHLMQTFEIFVFSLWILQYFIQKNISNIPIRIIKLITALGLGVLQFIMIWKWNFE